MSPTPRISQLATEATDRRLSVILADEQPVAPVPETVPPMSEADRIDTLKPSAEERALGSYDAIVVQRQREVDAAQATSRRLSARDAQSRPDTNEALAAPTELANEIAAAAAQMSAEDAAIRESAKNRNRVANRPVVDQLAARLAAVKKVFKQLRAEHLVNVTALAEIDFKAARRRIPLRIPQPGVNYDNIQALGLLIRAADSARLGLTTAFAEADRLEFLLETTIDSDTMSANFRSAYDWCAKEVAALETSLAAVKSQLATVDKFTADALSDIRIARDATVTTPPPTVTEYLPPMPPAPPSKGTSSYVEFDPRETPSTWLPREEPGTIRVQEGFGIRGRGYSTVLEPVSDKKANYAPKSEEAKS